MSKMNDEASQKYCMGINLSNKHIASALVGLESCTIADVRTHCTGFHTVLKDILDQKDQIHEVRNVARKGLEELAALRQFVDDCNAPAETAVECWYDNSPVGDVMMMLVAPKQKGVIWTPKDGLNG